MATKRKRIKKGKKRKKRNNNNKKKENSTLEPNPVDQSNYKLGDAGDDDYPPSPAPSISPRANDCSAKTFRVYNHNVNGLRDETKIEYIPRIMKKKNIDAYLIHETHLSRDFENFIIDNYYFIHHGPEAQPTNGAKGGVAIILSPELHSQWQPSGKAKKIIRGGILAGETTRILSVSMKLEVYSESNGEKKKKYHNLCLTTIYFPHSDYKEKEIDSFNNDLSTFLSNILSQKNTTHIIGADTNSSIGTRISTSNFDSSPNDEDDEDPISNLLGPFGNPRKSKSVEAILNHIPEFQL